jgi:hypothetical protein
VGVEVGSEKFVTTGVGGDETAVGITVTLKRAKFDDWAQAVEETIITNEITRRYLIGISLT